MTRYAGSVLLVVFLIIGTPFKAFAQCDISLTVPIYDEQTFIAGCDVQINGVVTTEEGCPEIIRIEWFWDDGSINESWFPAAHTYATNGDYLVSVTAFDSGGGSATETVPVSVVDCASACEISLTVPINDDATWVSDCSIRMNGVVITEPGCPDIERIEWEWGDGKINDSWFPAAHRYDSPGEYVVSVTPISTDGDSVTDTVPVSVGDCVSPVRVGNNSWLQVTETTGFSWNEIAEVCDATTGDCNTTVLGSSAYLDGWTWASRDDVTALFSVYVPGFTGVDIIETDSSWAPNFIADFNPTDQNPPSDFVMGTTRSLSDSSNAWAAIIDDYAVGDDSVETDLLRDVAQQQLHRGGWFRQRDLLKGGDADGNRRSDILWRNSASGQTWLYLMNGPAIATSVGLGSVSTAWSIVGNGDYNGDGSADILWRNTSTGQNWMYLMNGWTINTSASVNTVASQNWQVIGSGDYNGDGNADILWRNVVSGQNWMYLMNGDSIATSAWVNTIPTSWNIVGSGDYDGDGNDDILLRNSSSGQNYVYFMNGATISSGASINTVANQDWQVAGTGDYDGDGDADILWRNVVSGQNWMYLMNGSSIVVSGGVNTVPISWNIVGSGDYDGDGNSDILWRNSLTGQNWMYLMSGISISSSVSVNTVGDQNWQAVSTQ